MGEDENNNADNPGVIAPPPLIYAGALLAGLLANRRFYVPFLPRRAETYVDPYKPATAIVTDGPYRFTRNPLYLSMTMIYGGVSALANAFSPILLLPLVLRLMRRGVIEREERYLERKFGDVYLEYKVRAPRWI
jgi:protein-S-isoprenylcysteine O-methyltransferase Ste14